MHDSMRSGVSQLCFVRFHDRFTVWHVCFIYPKLFLWKKTFGGCIARPRETYIEINVSFYYKFFLLCLVISDLLIVYQNVHASLERFANAFTSIIGKEQYMF